MNDDQHFDSQETLAMPGDYVRMLTTAEKRVAWCQARMHEGMYNHVRLSMALGTVAAACAAAAFLMLTPPTSVPVGVVCAVLAFVLAYIPWFTVTAARFEQQERATGVNTELSLLSREDLSRPLTLMTKVALVAIGFPVAFVIFFAPYTLYRFLLRPVFNAFFLRMCMRCCCWMAAYIVLPLKRRLVAFLGDACMCFVCSVLIVVMIPVYLAKFIGLLCSLIGTACLCFCEHVMTPIGHGIWKVGHSIYLGFACVGKTIYLWILAPSGRGILWLSTTIWQYFLKPCGLAVSRVLKCIGQAVGRVLACIGQAVGRVLECIGKAVSWLLECISQAISGTAAMLGRAGNWLWDLISPCLNKVARGICAVLQVCRSTSCLLLDYFCSALCLSIYYFCRAIYTVIDLFCRGLVIPFVRCIGQSCTLVFSYTILPLGRLLFSLSSVLMSAISWMARTFGAALGCVFFSVGTVIASVAWGIASVIATIGQAVSEVIVAVGRVFR